MRRVALALISTIAGLSALLSFKTEVTAATGTPAAVTATGPASGATASSATQTVNPSGSRATASSAAVGPLGPCANGPAAENPMNGGVFPEASRKGSTLNP